MLARWGYRLFTLMTIREAGFEMLKRFDLHFRSDIDKEKIEGK